MINIGIAEDQALVRESLAIVMELEDDLTVSWKVENGRRALEAFKNQRVDMVLMDLRMPEVDGVSATKQIKALSSQTKVIVLTTFDHDEWILDALHAGASVCFLKDIPPKPLMEAVRLIHFDQFNLMEWSDEWRKYAPDIQLKAKIGTHTNPINLGSHKTVTVGQETLTHRDIEVLSRLAHNLTNAEIAQALFLTEGTVKNYVSNLYLKIGVQNRAEAIHFAKQRGIV